MEACSDTLDQLILDDKMSEKLWLSALMQIIMTLITYQKVFSFTHNDLHTNNVMYVSTKKKFVYYCFKVYIIRFRLMVKYSKSLILVSNL